MMTFNQHRSVSRPWMLLWLACAAALLLLPQRTTNTVRWLWQSSITPARTVVAGSCGRCRDYSGALSAVWTDTTNAAQLRLEVDRLQAQVAELEARERVALLADVSSPAQRATLVSETALLDKPAVAPTDDVTGSSASASEALLRSAVVEARVLGPLAQAWLVERRHIDRGRRAGVQDGALVLALSPVLDRGRDAQLAADHFVMAGGRVWGRVQRTGECTSEVRRVTDEGYRDLVTLHSIKNTSSTTVAPRGILEGSGGPLCRVRLVSADEPVSVGDVVASAAAQGYCDGLLVYGDVVRAECPAGASHWDVWVKPALDPSEVPQVVSVLRIEFNPARVASREQ